MIRDVVLHAIVVAAVTGGCARNAARSELDAGTRAPAASTTIDAGSTVPEAGSAREAKADAGARCVAAALQPGSCFPPAGPIKGEQFVAWFTKQGVERKALDAVPIDGCDEVVVSVPEEKALACIKLEPVTVAPSSADGPVQIETSLEVLSVRDRKPFELATVPLSVASSHWGELLFQARYAFDPSTRSLDVMVDTEDCKAAPTRLAEYWAPKLAEARGTPAAADLTRFIGLERQKGAARVAKICKVARRYKLP